MNNTQQLTTQTVANQPSLISSLLPIVLIIAVFYFLIMRPQQKKEQERQKMINEAKKGDRIVTSSGIIGVIHKILNEKEAVLEIAENVKIRILKSSIAAILDNKIQVEALDVENKKIEIKSNKVIKNKKDTATNKDIPVKKDTAIDKDKTENKDTPVNIEK